MTKISYEPGPKQIRKIFPQNFPDATPGPKFSEVLNKELKETIRPRGAENVGPIAPPAIIDAKVSVKNPVEIVANRLENLEDYFNHLVEVYGNAEDPFDSYARALFELYENGDLEVQQENLLKAGQMIQRALEQAAEDSEWQRKLENVFKSFTDAVNFDTTVIKLPEIGEIDLENSGLKVLKNFLKNKTNFS